MRQACTKVCDCFAETSTSGSVPSSGFSSGGANCVDDCVASGTSASGGTSGDISQACINCINTATCDGLNNGSACTAECDM